MSDTVDQNGSAGEGERRGAELWEAAERHVIRYAGDFLPLLIERAAGSATWPVWRRASN